MRALAPLLLCVLAGCTLLFDDARYLATDAAVDAPSVRCPASGCGMGRFCATTGCRPCDGDGDGFVADRSCTTTPSAQIDCDDTNAAIHPGAAPTCGNGVDESCGARGPIGFPSDEIGFFAAQEIVLATGTIPSHVRVFSRTPTTALVVFHDSAASDRSVWTADVPLSDAPHTPMATDWLTYAGGMRVRDETYRFDALRDAGGQIHVVLVRERAPTLGLLDTRVPPTGMPAPVNRTVDLTTLGSGPATTGDPALVRVGTNLYLGQPMRVTDAMGTASPVVVTIGVTTPHVDLTGRGGDPNGPWGAVSNGTAAAFAAPMGTLLLWNGSLDTSAGTDELAHLNARALGRPAMASLMAPGTAQFREAIIAPVATGFDLYVAPCASDLPWSACPPNPPANGHIPMPLASDPHLSSFTVGPTQFALLYASRMTMMGSDLMFAFVDASDPATAMIMPFAMPAPGIEPIEDTAMDAALDAQGTAAHPSALQITVAYAYVRHISAMPARLYVGGVRVCVGFGGR